MDELLQEVANAYGCSMRELTVGQLVDFFQTTGKRKEEKEDEKRKEAKEKREEIRIKEKGPQNQANLIELQQICDEFEVLWKKYPRKAGKKDAIRHYISARRKKIPFQTISDGLDRYNAYIERNGIEKNYIKHGSSWFCEEAWDDDYTADRKKPSSPKPNTFKNFDERDTNYDALLERWSQ